MKHRHFHVNQARNSGDRAARRCLAARWMPVLLLALATAVAAAPRKLPMSFWHPEIAPSGPMIMVVSLDEQHLYVYRNGVVIGVSPISSGKAGYETPTGVYTILQKEREHYSNLYQHAPMPYMQRLTWDGVALHAGVLPGRADSHGCIRLPATFAGELYKVTRPGDVVVVADGKVSPASIVHPSAVAPVDLTGQPVTLPDGSHEAGVAPMGTPREGPLSIIISTADRTAYVLRNGHLVARAAVGVAPDAGVQGILLYVMEDEPPAGGAARTALHRWSGYRIRGSGPVPEPAVLSRRIRLPKAFGEDLRKALRPGTTVLVTNLPGYGRSPDPSYGALLQSAMPPNQAQ
jgi:hypothetical protein